MPEAIVSLSTDENYQPGYRPVSIVVNQDKAKEFFRLQKAGRTKAEDLETLRREAFDLSVNKKGYARIRKHDGLIVNSLLRKDEWEELDAAVIDAVTQELNAVDAFRGAGLTQPLGGLGTFVSQFNVASERTAASISMSGRAVGGRDRVEKRLRSVPVPIVHAEYEIGIRELMASRNTGDALDLQEARAAAQVVAEKLEELVFDGDTSIVIAGDGIDGMTTHSARDTDTAANYGGGDFGTVLNGPITVLGMISTLAALNYRGPFGVFVSNTQYFQLMEPQSARFGTDLESIEAIPQVSWVRRSDFLPDGEVILVQLTASVIDLAIAMEPTNREWSSGDDMAFYGKVLASITPRLKQDFAGNLGVAHATAA